MHYLLDTNTCIYLIKNRPPEVLEQFKQHSPKDVAISIITLFELEYGVKKSQYRQRSQDALNKFLLPLNLIDMDRPSAIEAASIRADLERKGMPIGPYDLLIAGLGGCPRMAIFSQIEAFSKNKRSHMFDISSIIF